MYEETASVVQWFTLGLYLKLAPSELERISVDYHFNHEGLQQMLGVWLKTGDATWHSLVCALKNMGQSDLASKIARKKGVCVCMFVCECECVFMCMCMHVRPFATPVECQLILCFIFLYRNSCGCHGNQVRWTT